MLNRNDPPTKSVQTVPIGCIRRSQDQQMVLKMQFSKILLSETTMPRAFILSI